MFVLFVYLFILLLFGLAFLLNSLCLFVASAVAATTAIGALASVVIASAAIAAAASIAAAAAAAAAAGPSPELIRRKLEQVMSNRDVFRRSASASFQ